MNLPSTSLTVCMHAVRDILVSDVEEEEDRAAYIETF